MEIVKKHHPDRAGADNAESKAIFEVRNFAQGFDSGVMTSEPVQFVLVFGSTDVMQLSLSFKVTKRP